MKNRSIIIFVVTVALLAATLSAAVYIYPKLAYKYSKTENSQSKSETTDSASEDVSSDTASAENAESDKSEADEGAAESIGEFEPEEKTSADSDTPKRETAEDFVVYDADGNAVSLSDNRGKPTVVNFWATWCGYCVNELPDFDKLYAQYKGEVNFMMVDLPNSKGETKDGALEFIKKNGYTFPVYFDTQGSASNAYNLSSIPRTLFVDKNGGLYKDQLGAMNESTIKQYLEELTEE